MPLDPVGDSCYNDNLFQYPPGDPKVPHDGEGPVRGPKNKNN